MQTQFFFLSPVEVVKVTPNNLAEVAEWCGGAVAETESRRTPNVMDAYVWVPTPAKAQISWAFPGMYITKRLVLTTKGELKATWAVFRRDYFERNYFDNQKAAVDATWEVDRKNNPPKQVRITNTKEAAVEQSTGPVSPSGLMTTSPTTPVEDKVEEIPQPDTTTDTASKYMEASKSPEFVETTQEINAGLPNIPKEAFVEYTKDEAKQILDAGVMPEEIKADIKQKLDSDEIDVKTALGSAGIETPVGGVAAVTEPVPVEVVPEDVDAPVEPVEVPEDVSGTRELTAPEKRSRVYQLLDKYIQDDKLRLELKGSVVKDEITPEEALEMAGIDASEMNQ